MCLNIPKNAVVQIAKENIIVYKRLHIRKKLTYCGLKSGDKVQIINYYTEDELVDAIISINKERRIFFCTNDSRLNGLICNNKYGYSYSWILDSNIKKVIKDGVTLKKRIKQYYITPYQDFKVSMRKTYTSLLIREKGSLEDRINIGLHSFRHKEDAQKDALEGHIVQCTIPKGSKYYLGKFMDMDSYASDKLRYDKNIRENNQSKSTDISLLWRRKSRLIT